MASLDWKAVNGYTLDWEVDLRDFSYFIMACSLDLAWRRIAVRLVGWCWGGW